MEKKREYKLRKATRKNTLMALTQQSSAGDLEQQQKTIKACQRQLASQSQRVLHLE